MLCVAHKAHQLIRVILQATKLNDFCYLFLSLRAQRCSNSKLLLLLALLLGEEKAESSTGAAESHLSGKVNEVRWCCGASGHR